MERSELDDHENPPDHYGELADCFNDYEGYHYLNPTFHPETKEALPGMDVAFGILKDINPCMGPDIRPPRGADWIKNELRTFRKCYNEIYSKFHASGNHDAFDIYLEFSKFFQGNTLVFYGFVLIKGDEIVANELMGKLLVDIAANDTGILNNPNSQQNEREIFNPMAPIARSEIMNRVGNGSVNRRRRDHHNAEVIPPTPSTIATPAPLSSSTQRTITIDWPAYNNRVNDGNSNINSQILQEEKNEFDLNMTVINSVAPVIVNSGIQEESLSNLRDLLDQMKRRRLSHNREGNL